jgi:pSer/pThr/pTyr-binding forkhead associated (FHA) protein
MGEAGTELEWQTLADLAKGAALPPEIFKAQFGGPFLLEINPEQAQVASGETRGFDPGKVGEVAGPSLQSSQILNLGQGGQLVIGRGEGSNLRVRHPSVSDRHAMLERIGPLWAIKDAGSKNGTYLNGKRLGPDEQLPLKFGTKLMMGEAQFLFLGPDDCYELLQELIKEPRIRPRSIAKFRADFKAAGTPEKILEDFPGPFLVVQAPAGRDAEANVSSNTITLSREELAKTVNRNVADAIFDLSRHNLVRIGRATVTQIHLPLGAISNLHAALVREADHWVLQDLGAKNGTYIWGDKVEGRRPLESGSEITLGNIKSIFFNTPDFVTYASQRDTLS